MDYNYNLKKSNDNVTNILSGLLYNKNVKNIMKLINFKDNNQIIDDYFYFDIEDDISNPECILYTDNPSDNKVEYYRSVNNHLHIKKLLYSIYNEDINNIQYLLEILEKEFNDCNILLYLLYIFLYFYNDHEFLLKSYVFFLLQQDEENNYVILKSYS